MTINEAAKSARENARTGSGKFGHQIKSVDNSASNSLGLPADWSDPVTIKQHLATAGLDGEVTIAQPGHRYFDDNINETGHLLYQNQAGEVIAMGRNSVGTLVSSAVQEMDTEGYFITEFNENTAPAEVVNQTFADRDDDELFDIQVDYTDAQSVEEGLVIAGLQGEVEQIDASHRLYNSEFATQPQILYTSPNNRKILVTTDDIGQTHAISNPGEDDYEARTTYSHPAPTAEVIGGAVARAVINEVLDEAFEPPEDTYYRQEAEIGYDTDGNLNGSILVSTEEGDYYRVQHSGDSNTTEVVDEHSGDRIDQQTEEEIMNSLLPIYVSNGTPYRPGFGQVFAGAIKNIQMDPDYTEQFDKELGLS